jgi:hypothetical protein
VRTSGAGNDSLMTMVVVGIALGVSIFLLGGPAEFARVVNGLVHDAVESGIAFGRFL